MVLFLQFAVAAVTSHVVTLCLHKFSIIFLDDGCFSSMYYGIRLKWTYGYLHLYFSKFLNECAVSVQSFSQWFLFKQHVMSRDICFVRKHFVGIEVGEDFRWKQWVLRTRIYLQSWSWKVAWGTQNGCTRYVSQLSPLLHSCFSRESVMFALSENE